MFEKIIKTIIEVCLKWYGHKLYAEMENPCVETVMHSVKLCQIGTKEREEKILTSALTTMPTLLPGPRAGINLNL